MTAAKKQPTEAAAARHHTGRQHPGERDIDLGSPCSDPELKILLKLLRPLLQEVIRASERCRKKNPGQGFAGGNYHNITVCSGKHP
jgi:hypothetical protein